MNPDHPTRAISWIIIVLGMLFSNMNSAQISQKKDSLYTHPDWLEDIIQFYMESRADEGEFDFNTIIDQLEVWRKKPIHLNDPDELAGFYLLSAYQRTSIKDYILSFGKLISIYELQAVPGMDIETIHRIVPYIALDPNFEHYEVPLTEMLRYADHQLFFRTGRILEPSRGFTDGPGTKFQGSRDRLYLRYQHRYENKLSIGITAEKDPGESFFKKSNRMGFDFYSFHAAVQNINRRLKALVVGDFTFSMGQGLIMHSGFGVSKSPWTTQIRRADRPIRAYTSINESNFLRGAAVQLNLISNLTASLMASSRKKDGNFVADSITEGNRFTSFQESGYHRTASEIDDEKRIEEKMAGLIIRWDQPGFHIALNQLYTQFDPPFIRRNQLYNQYAFRGARLYQFSLDHSFRWRNMYFFGEWAQANTGSSAWIQGAQMTLDKKLDLAFLFRKLDKSFPALYSNAFTENTLAQNETGFYMGIDLKPHPRWQWLFYWDVWSHPWLRYATQAPSRGSEWFSRLQYSIRKKMDWYIQFRSKSREENRLINRPIRDLALATKSSIRSHLTFHWSKIFETRTRLEYNVLKLPLEKTEHGWMVFQDLFYKPPRAFLAGSTRIAYYQTQSYDSGIYAYENDLLYNFYIPNYYGRGWRFYLNLESNAINHCTLECRYALTYRPGSTSIGSGLDQITGPRKSEIKFQIRWQF
jgi:hypothetical protein